MSSPLPILDIRLWRTNPQAFTSKLRHACHKIGFFLLRHDMPPSLPRRQLEECRYFFNELPISTKLSLSYEKSPAFRGYMPLGVENTSGKIDMRESFEIGPEEEDETGRKAAWPPYERLRGSNPWPDDDQPSLRECVKEYSSHVIRIADILRHAMCRSLGVSDSDDVHSLFNDPHCMIRMISYSPTVAEIETTEETTKTTTSSPKMTSTEMTLGVGAHTDTNFLTLVLQDDVGGLQVYTDGTWIDVPSNIPNVLVCNLGEQAEILSNGYFLATPHRVSMSSSPRDRSRVSVATFYNPTLSATLTPMMELSPDLLPWEREYEPWRMGRNTMLGSCGENTFKSLARSHPVVFRKHHGDLKLLDDGRIVKLDDGGGEIS